MNMNIEKILENKEKIIKGIISIIKVIVILLILIYVFVIYNSIASQETCIVIKRTQIKNEMQKELEMLAEIEELTKEIILEEEFVREEFINSRINVNEKIKKSDMYSLNVAYNEMFIAFKNYDELIRKKIEIFNMEEYIEKVDMLVSIRQNVVIARQEYYLSVTEYNRYIRIFPNKIIAFIFGFKQMTV